MHAELPHGQFIYLGDTARLPYGTKIADTVARYALQAADVLVDRGVKVLIVACNTASAVALHRCATATGICQSPAPATAADTCRVRRGGGLVHDRDLIASQQHA